MHIPISEVFRAILITGAAQVLHRHHQEAAVHHHEVTAVILHQVHIEAEVQILMSFL